MKLIAHRGNFQGSNKEMENRPEYISQAIQKGYDCEIDVWSVKDRLYLGHDEPQYEINLRFLQNNKLWCHAKNLAALEYMLLNSVHCFWHQEDDVTLTSMGYLWTYPGKPLTLKSICVMPEHASYSKEEITRAAGVCSDNIQEYRR